MGFYFDALIHQLYPDTCTISQYKAFLFFDTSNFTLIQEILSWYMDFSLIQGLIALKQGLFTFMQEILPLIQGLFYLYTLTFLRYKSFLLLIRGLLPWTRYFALIQDFYLDTIFFTGLRQLTANNNQRYRLYCHSNCHSWWGFHCDSLMWDSKF